jgi:diguanylate cyclase (GGDEF)-like protein
LSNVVPVEKGRDGQHGFPLRLFAAAFAISLLVVAVGAGLSWRLRASLDELRTRQSHLAEYVSRVMLFDEALTMSARMAAATGDFAYKQRYDKLDAELDALINETKGTLQRPEVRQFVEQTDEANRKLVEIERRAFALTSERQLTEATALLVSDEYLTLKGIYAGGVEKTVAWQRSAIEGEQRTLHNLTIGFQISSGLVVLLLLSSWYFALRAGRRWSQERLRSEAILRKAHDELELRVGERTADLQLANETLRHHTEALTHEAEERKCVNDRLKTANDRIEKQNSIFDAALSNMLQGLAMFDADERLVVCNNKFIEMYDLSRDIAKPGCTLREILKHRVERGHLRRDPEQYRNELLAKGERVNLVLETADGREISITNQPMPGGGWILTHEDITERRKAEARISHMALHDALTNLPNRRFFHEQMKTRLTHLSRDQKFAVLCLDLDRFKTVNDTLGHPFGDMLLRQAAERMRGCLREGDTIARLGGDEFAILQGSIKQPHDAIALAARLIEATSAPFEFDGHQVAIGVSIGIAIAPTDASDADQLLKNADMALYRAKADGCGTYRFFESKMDALLQARRALELDLRKALANDEFELYYQPLVNLKSQEISGFEALIRWNHPQRGLVAPLEFIPLAEETGLIVLVGEWVLRQACAEAMKWPDHITIAVNLSPAQFKMRNLFEMVMSALGQSGLAPQRLELEITESVLLVDSESTLAILHQLHDLGVRISMDDFGTGYSSLSYLRSFPFDKIKIDRSFVHDLASKADSKAIISAVTGLGSSLGITTTGEGVETQEELEYLRREGCTEAQGYFFSKPKPAGEVLDMISKQLVIAKAAA